MDLWPHLSPPHSLPVPAELRGTWQALFFLLRGHPAPVAVRSERPRLAQDSDTFLFSF